ncbi:MAG: hypothetical protein ACRCW1_07205 [Anaerotignaceae bacterium]
MEEIMQDLKVKIICNTGIHEILIHNLVYDGKTEKELQLYIKGFLMAYKIINDGYKDACYQIQLIETLLYNTVFVHSWDKITLLKEGVTTCK